MATEKELMNLNQNKMEAKLIKTEVNYLLKNEEGVIIASTSIKKGISSLSRQNCEELFGVVDVEKLANDSFDKKFNKDSEQLGLYDVGFINGFNKATELNKGKVFTYNQMVSAITESSISHRLPSLIIQDLQPTEIDVEIVTESKLIGQCNCPCHTKKGIRHIKDCCNPKRVETPKLDSEGQLILKNI